jgi:hypothetical protein
MMSITFGSEVMYILPVPVDEAPAHRQAEAGQNQMEVGESEKTGGHREIRQQIPGEICFYFHGCVFNPACVEGVN